MSVFRSHLLLSYAAITCLLVPLEAVDSSHTQEAFCLKRIREYWKEGDTLAARKQTLAYLERFPNSDVREELHLFLGDVCLQEQNYAEALEHYQQIEKSSLHNQIAYHKILCLHELREHTELLSAVEKEKNLSIFSKEEQQSLHYLQANANFQLAKQESSIEKKQKLLQLALREFSLCMGTPYETHSLLPLAYTYKMLGNEHMASSCFLRVAQINGERKEDFLFEAALLQSKFSHDAAIDTFQQIIRLKKNHTAEAAYNYLMLLFQDKRYKEVVLHYEEVKLFIPPQLIPKIEYAVGKSLYMLGDYSLSARYLTDSLEAASLPKEISQEGLFLILECAYKTQDLDRFQEIFTTIQNSSPDDSRVANAHLAYADLLKKKGLVEEQQEVLETFIYRYPSHSTAEKVLFDLALANYEAGSWCSAEKHLATLSNSFPKSKLQPQAERLQINCAIQRLQKGSGELKAVHRQQVISVLKHAVETPHILSSQEKEDFSHALIQYLFQDGQYLEAIEMASKYLKDLPQSPHCTNVLLLKTLSYLQSNDIPAFIEHAELCLDQTPNLSEFAFLHLHLYNHYLQNPEKVELAADHLFCVLKTHAVKTANLEWLANYYFTSNSQKALVVYELLLNGSHNLSKPSEIAAMYQYSLLLGNAKQWHRVVSVLEEWISQSFELSEKEAGTHKMLLLQLALAYQSTGMEIKALELYDLLIKAEGDMSSIHALALFEKAKLQYKLLSDEEKEENNPMWAEIANELKDVEIRKHLSSEPLHLEAALEYVHYKSDLCKNQKERQEKMVHLLQLVKENFAEELDEALTEKDSLHLQKKAEVHQLYMSFIDAEILRIQGDETAHSSAADRFAELLQHPSIPTELKLRIERSCQEMQGTL